MGKNEVMRFVCDIVRHDDAPIDKDERIELYETIAEFTEGLGYCCGGWIGTPNDLSDPGALIKERDNLKKECNSLRKKLNTAVIDLSLLEKNRIR